MPVSLAERTLRRIRSNVPIKDLSDQGINTGERVRKANLEAIGFAFYNRLEDALRTKDYNQASQDQISVVMRNAIAINLLSARTIRRKGFVEKLKKKLHTQNEEEVYKAIDVFIEGNQAVINPQGGPTNHFLGAVEAAVNSLFEDSDTAAAGKFSHKTKLSEERVEDWGNFWNPFIKSLGVSRIA